MTHTELTHYAERWLRSLGCGFVFRELVSYASEIPDAVGFTSGHSILVECKVSRADFLRDKKKWFRRAGNGIGQYRYYACPTGLILPSELPERWGLVYFDERGRATCQVNKTKRGHVRPREWRHEHDYDQERALFYTALRRIELRGLMPTIYDQPWKQPNSR